MYHLFSTTEHSVHLKVCVASSTNTAVDKILLDLVDSGFTDILRLGSDKIHPRLRKFRRKSTDFEADCDDIGESEFVIGVTCCASGRKTMHSLFNCEEMLVVTFVDECFQIPEALTLLPILFANPEKLILLGDPMQLPPVTIGDRKTGQGFGFGDPLYARLEKIGYQPIGLLKQYRYCAKMRIVFPLTVLFFSDAIQRSVILPPICFILDEFSMESRQ